MKRTWDTRSEVHRDLKKDKDPQKGEDVELVQDAYNDFAKEHPGLGLPLLDRDGIAGPLTIDALRDGARLLGVRMVRPTGVTKYMQDIIRHPGHRSKGEKARALKQQAKRRKGGLQKRAWHEMGDLVGIREHGGNNRGTRVDQVIRYALGQLGEPWCVDGDIWAYGHAGSQIVKPGFTRAVAFMLSGGVRRAIIPKTGDPVRFIFDHTGLFGYFCNSAGQRRPRLLATHIRTRECNTSSSGAVGSDINDGTDGCYEKIRSKSLVRDYLRVPK